MWIVRHGRSLHPQFEISVPTAGVDVDATDKVLSPRLIGANTAWDRVKVNSSSSVDTLPTNCLSFVLSYSLPNREDTQVAGASVVTKEEREEARMKIPSSFVAEQSVNVSVEGSITSPPDVMSI